MSKNNEDEIMNLVLSKLDKIDDKLEKQQEKVHAIDKTLERNTASLEEHMRRSDLLERKLEPVEKHVAHIQGALKLIGLIGLILGIVVSIIKLIG